MHSHRHDFTTEIHTPRYTPRPGELGGVSSWETNAPCVLHKPLINIIVCVSESVGKWVAVGNRLLWNTHTHNFSPMCSADRGADYNSFGMCVSPCWHQTVCQNQIWHPEDTERVYVHAGGEQRGYELFGAAR